MTESEQHHVVFESLGAYALGALPDHERDLVAAHLDDCPICAEDAASLRRASARLPDVVGDVEPSPDLRDRIMAVVEPEAELLRSTRGTGRRGGATAPGARRRRRFSPALRRAATAGIALVVGGVVGATALDGDEAGTAPGGGATRTLAAEVGRGHAWVEIHDGTAHLVVDGMAAPRGNRVYELWIQSGDAAPRPAHDDLSQAVFMVGSGRVEIPARLHRGDRVLVTAERPGGSRTPTAAPVVVTRPA